MLHFENVFNPKCTQNEEAVRTRILGETIDGRLLYMLNTTHNTRIELVSSDGSSFTVFSFQKYMDIVNAEISSDNEIVHLTERVPDPNGFAFNSVVFHIHSTARSKDWMSPMPIDAYFLNECQFPVYQMIHIVGNRMTHLRITLNKKKIDIEKIRTGVHISHLVASSFDKTTQILAAVYESEGSNYFADFHFNQETTHARPPIPIKIPPSATLPLEFALNPATRTHFPLFSCATNRFFFAHYHSKVAVIHQIYEGDGTDIQFNIVVFPKSTTCHMTVPGVRADVPLCFATFSSIVILYSPNAFACVVDIAQNPPYITILNSTFALSPCGLCAAVCPLSNHIVDIETGLVYRVSIDVTHPDVFRQSLEQTAWCTFAHLAARLGNFKFTAALFHIFELTNDFISLGTFAAELFTCLGASEVFTQAFSRTKSIPGLPGSLTGSFSGQVRSKPRHLPREFNELLKELELEFPSAGRITRTQRFRSIVKDLLQRKESKSTSDAASKALDKLRQQNESVLVLRDALDYWAKDCQASQTWQLCVGLVIQNECSIGNFPEIPCLKEEVSTEIETMCPDTIEALIQKAGIFGPMTWETNEDYDYWTARVPPPEKSSDSMGSRSGASWLPSRSMSRPHLDGESSDGSAVYY